MNERLSDNRIAVVPAAIIVIAEVFFYLEQPIPTFAIHGVNLLLCILLPVFLPIRPYLLPAFSLLSVLRMLNVGMPEFFSLTLYWLPLIYGPLIPAAYITLKKDEVYRKRIDSLKGRVKSSFVSRFDELGVEWSWYYLPLGILISIPLAVSEYLVLRPDMMVPELTPLYLLSLLLVMVLFVGFVEEVVFRSILQTRLQNNFGDWAGIVTASIFFGILHSGYSSMEYVFFVFLIGMFLGYLFHKTRSVAFVTIIHGFLNFFLFSVLAANIII
ncbi:type II CAAX endopeptidase family protein [Methanonatronarchaeum sp. AMET-Sl]|uniref:CPBP family intramembrane glutamic endopeptidase n=1 Tax=Methanonatronarchaeum sp. AMET-Sl TaxID=3037654 RepID=UPI00244E020E|nr:type II CAAX endopeptidase family protein [Methanonatronarchaeum sp. AMET-Sl]WGI17662.1 type II CAAX endopeptidase family protein [Methanonatronarchaeum sp. AMET-Sl]